MPSNDIRMIPVLQPQRVVASLSEVVDWGQKFAEIGKYQKRTGSLGEGVNVAILDTGTPKEHPDLTENVVSHVDFTPQQGPLHPHGCHVGGIVAAAADGRGVIGLAPKAKLHSVRVLDHKGFCPPDFRYPIAGLEWVLDHSEIDIVNMSLGAPFAPPPRMQHLIREISNKGVIVVAASGNEGALQVSWPARYEEVIAVGAIGPNGNLANFTNHDETLDVCAPGIDVYSTWMNGQPSYAKVSGTSMAAPFISGLLALMLSYHRNGEHHESPLTNYVDAIEALHNFKDGKLVAAISDEIGIGVMHTEEAKNRRSARACLSPEQIRNLHTWRGSIYKALEGFLRRFLLR